MAHGSLAETRAHLLGLTTRLSQLEEERQSMIEFNTKIADELKTQASLVTYYEENIRGLQLRMAEAAATGAWSHVPCEVPARLPFPPPSPRNPPHAHKEWLPGVACGVGTAFSQAT